MITKTKKQKDGFESVTSYILDICRSFLHTRKTKTSFEIKEYIHSLSVDELMKWSTGGYFPNTLMTIYQTGKIDLEELRNTEDVMLRNLWENWICYGFYRNCPRSIWECRDCSLRHRTNPLILICGMERIL